MCWWSCSRTQLLAVLPSVSSVDMQSLDSHTEVMAAASPLASIVSKVHEPLRCSLSVTVVSEWCRHSTLSVEV